MNDEQLLRYNRQIMLADVDIDGQQQLLASSALVVGLGGLGCPIAMYLAASGIGRLVLADFDRVDLSNLQRQIAHGMDDIGGLKVDSAAATIASLNPDITVETINTRLDSSNLKSLVESVDVIVDASDNFRIRFQLNIISQQLKKPLISGAAIKMQGQVSVFDARDASKPCYHCLYKDDSNEEMPSCAEAGVLSPVVGVIGALQATETIKVLLNKEATLAGHLLLYDATTASFRKIKLSKDSHCPVCAMN